MVKENIRKIIIDKRKALDTKELVRLSNLIVENIKGIEDIKNSTCYMFYYPMSGEPNILPLAEEFLGEGVCVCFPTVKDQTLCPVMVKDFKSFRKSNLGVYEPAVGRELKPSSLDVVFVPGLAFDTELYRVGFGRGFYDRFLKLTDAVKVGVAFDFQIMENLPHDEWDVPVDILVTPYDILRRR